MKYLHFLVLDTGQRQRNTLRDFFGYRNDGTSPSCCVSVSHTQAVKPCSFRIKAFTAGGYFCAQPTIPCSNCTSSGPSPQFIRVETGWRMAQTHPKAPITPPQPLSSVIIHGRVNQSLSESFRGLIPPLLARGSRQYPHLSLYGSQLWYGSWTRSAPASPALNVHGSPQLSLYFRIVQAYLSPAGPSETMGVQPYPNTGSQTIWRTPGRQHPAPPPVSPLLPNKEKAKG